MNFEIAILDWIQKYMQNSILDTFFALFTRLGDAGILWLVLAIAMICFKKTRKVGIILLVSLAFEAIICNLIIKPIVGRTRPYEVNNAVKLLINKPIDSSFPSGHTCASFTIVSALYCCKERLWVPCLITAVLIAFSRLYLYVHFPSDVLVGLLLGLFIGWLGYFVVEKVSDKMQKA